MSSFNQTQRNSMGSCDRKLRYRALLQELASVEDESSNNLDLMNRTASAVQVAQSLFAEGDVEERAKHPGEGYLDSSVFRAASHLVVRYSDAITGNVHSYDKHELAQHIKENPEYWTFAFPREVPTVSYLYGSFAPTPPGARPPRRRVQRQQARALKAPDNVESLEKVDECSQMVSRVNHFIMKTYRKTREPLSYFHTVLDPHSFSATIENIYYVSFLVRDSLVSVYTDEEFGLPFITPLAAPEEKRDLADENQFIVSMDMPRWRELVEAFGITNPMMVFKR